MIGPLLPGIPHDDERGVLALAVALAVSALLFLSGLLAYQVASANQSDASLRRIDAQALDAAEGGLSRAYQAIQAASGASQLPCSVSEILTTAPAKSSYSATLTYYDTFPPSDGPLSCSNVQSGTATPQAVEVISTGTTGAGTGQRTDAYMEALVKVSVSSGSVFDDALFSNQTFTGVNSATLYGYNGLVDANLYTNGNIVCGNNYLVQGNVTAQGSFTGSNSCTVQGNLTAVGNITAAQSTVISGNASSVGSSGCGTVGNISLSNNASVGQNAYAYCSISLQNNATVTHVKYPNDTTLAYPTVETLPSVPMPVSGSTAAAGWAAAGYAIVTDNNCTNVYTDISNMSAASSPTVIMTSCALSWSNHSVVSLNQNLAIYSTGGFSMANNTTWQSTNSTTRLLYLLVPSSVSGTPTTCSSGSPGITFTQNTSFATTVNVLDYTPCTVSIANNSTGYGQVYGGQVNAANNFTAHYVPMPTVPGSSGGGSVSASTTIAVVYERQIFSLSQA
jgi:hypothetical protein